MDTGSIYVGGLSNGGFMTCRLLADWPGLFSAGVACCAPWVGELGTDEEYAAMARTPLWFVQVDDDSIVGAEEHVRATLPHLLAAGAARAARVAAAGQQQRDREQGKEEAGKSLGAHPADVS